MAEINFYHLTRSTPEAALYQLLSKAYEAGQRSIVRFAGEEDVSVFDTALWARDPAGFLPHGSKTSPRASEQPVLLTDRDDNPNKAAFVFIFPEASVENIDFYERAFILFEGASETQVEEARTRWKKFLDQGLKPVYWTQDDRGKWSKKDA